jgi:glycerol-3-phosphate acyltransferase PlsY
MIVVSIILSYLMGAIPTAYIAGKILKGIDIRKYGSGNVGATNVFRVLGKGPGIVVLLIDILKGIIPVAVIADCLQTTSLLERILISLFAVAGHNWTVFLQFKGGKGIATTLGVLIGLTIRIVTIRPVLLYTLLSWVVVFLLSGFVSLASIIAAVLLPLFMILTSQPFSMILLGIIFCAFVVLRHRPNIRRLLSGEENKVPLPFHRKKNS